jgi:hypothetical protein
MTNVVPYSTNARARFRASERRAWLARILEAQTRPVWAVEEIFAPETKPKESLPNEDPSESFAQLVRLRWQMDSNALLLLGHSLS